MRKWWVASDSHRVLAGQEPGLHCQSLQPKRDTKAESNRRSQACEVLAGTGIRVARKWTGMRVARPLLRFGRPACISQHLYPEKWSPVWESHPPAWFCRPLPRLLGQRDVIKFRRRVKDQILCRVDPDNHVDSPRLALNRSRSPRCNACGRESREECRSALLMGPGWKRTLGLVGCPHDTEIPNEGSEHDASQRWCVCDRTWPRRALARRQTPSATGRCLGHGAHDVLGRTQLCCSRT